MRLLKKIAIKFITMAIMVILMGTLLRFAKPYIMKSAGMPEGMPSAEGVQVPKFASEESDLMATVFKSALRFLSGNAKRDELAGELSNKLYAGRGDSGTMSELGIELVQPGAKPSDPTGLLKPGSASSSSSSSSSSSNGATTVKAQPGATSPVKSTQPSAAPAKNTANTAARDALLAQVWDKAKANPELSLIPIVLVGMFVVRLFRRRRSPEDDFVLPDLSTLIPSEPDGYEMTHRVHSLRAEDFELLVALIYQRQGYRVTMPAGLSGGRGGDFLVQRKSEKLLVQCKKFGADYKVPVDRVKDLHEAAVAAGVTRGVYVASCGFSWGARNFAKTKGVTAINARTLDTLLNEARERPDENFLAVWEWAPKLLSKVKLTPPLCPACEAPMDELNVSSGPVWVCSQRPECKGRRCARKVHKSGPTAGSTAYANSKPQTTSDGQACDEPVFLGGRARTICPSTS
jgi:Restriction endonuclease